MAYSWEKPGLFLKGRRTAAAEKEEEDERHARKGGEKRKKGGLSPAERKESPVSSPSSQKVNPT